MRKAISAAETIRTQILFTQDYQDIGVGAAHWQNLDALIRKSIDALDLSGIDIRHSLQDIWVFADPSSRKYSIVFWRILSAMETEYLRYRFPAYECESGLMIVYEDDGIGIPVEAKEKIFRREYFQNTGLGLYLIRQILEITRIGIRETGIFGRGVRFEISVPSGKYGMRVGSRVFC